LLEQVNLPNLNGIFQVVVGCETGKGARWCNPAWVSWIIRDCAAQGVKCYVKELYATGKAPFEQWPAELRVRELA